MTAILDKCLLWPQYVVNGGNRLSVSATDIASYLTRIKDLLGRGKYDFVLRRKNLQALAFHGMSIKDVKNEIFSLNVSDYYKGPRQDYDSNRPGDIWEFKKSINGYQFYVKVKVVRENGEEILRCMSFHDDEFT